MNTLSPRVCSAIETLTLDKYIDCACNQNLRALALSDDAGDEELQLAWRHIRSAYIEASADRQSAYLLRRGWELESGTRLGFAVQELLYWFSLMYDKRFADALRALGYDYAFSAESYLRDIACLRTELSCEAMQLQEAALQLNDGAPEAAPTPKLFYKTVLMLQKQIGIFPNCGPVAACRQMTVYEFITCCQLYEEMIARENPKTQ